MAKGIQSTRVIINGVDVSAHVLRAALPRIPQERDTVALSMLIASLDVTPDGVLVIEIDTRE